MKRVKKLISVIIVVAMVLTILPINVFAAVGSYSISAGSTTLKVGKTTNLYIKCTKAAGKFNIVSSNSSVASVSVGTTWVDNANMDDTIVIKGLSKGTATITVTPVDVSDTEYNLLTTPKSITITVKEEAKKPTTNTDDNKKDNNKTDNNNKVEEEDALKSSDAKLKSLTVTGEDIDFNAKTTKYSLEVPYDTTSLTIKAVPNDSKATVSISGNKDFKVGENTVNIKVTAEDGTIKVYTITVTREEEIVKGTAPLLDLKVKNYTINEKFNPSRTSYTVETVNESQVELEYVLGNKNFKVEITGDKNLKIGLNEVKLKVTEPNGTVTVYTVNVNNTNIVEENNIIWLIIIIILAVLVIIETTYIIIKKKKEDK